MSSSRRVLRQPSMGPELRIATPDPALLDPVVRARVEEAATRARAQGHAEGVAEGRRALLEDGARLAEAIRAGGAEAAERLAQARAARADEVVELALALARAVLDREPHDGGIALLRHVRAALEQIDDEPLTVRVSPADAAVVERGLADLHGIAVAADPSIAPGEGRISGPWAHADLRAAAALEALRDVLDG